MKTCVLIAVLFAANVCHGSTLPRELDPLRTSPFGDGSPDRYTERLLREINNPSGFSSNTPLGNDQLNTPPSPSGGLPVELRPLNSYLKKYAMSYPLEWVVTHPEQNPLVRRGGQLLVNTMRSPWGAAALTLLYPNPAY
ncbi:uncharacterized protein LOC144132489 [Amblyomma americanum]